MSLYEKLMNVQGKTKASKSEQNNYYKYRNVEQIMQAVKPHLREFKATIYCSDELVMIGERYYIKATATFVDLEDGTSVSTTAYSREPLTSRTMGESQITGSTSSYARKYALCGLLLLDDSKVEEKILDCDSQQYLENEDIHPDADKVPQNRKPATKQGQGFDEKKTDFLGGVRFAKDNECEVWLSGKYKNIKQVTTGTLEKLKESSAYKQAWDAIQCELNVRSLKEGKQ